MTDLISRRDAIKDAESWVAVDGYEKHLQKNVVEWLKEFPSANVGELIRRQDAIDAISCDITITGRQNAELVAKTIGTFADRIKALPTVKPKKGKWIKYQKEDYDGSCYEWCKCSNCDGDMVSHETDFCPNCGADMRGENSE